jgi:hypothetical protein
MQLVRVRVSQLALTGSLKVLDIEVIVRTGGVAWRAWALGGLGYFASTTPHGWRWAGSRTGVQVRDSMW